MTKTVLGVIGGSGVYEFPGLKNERWERVESPWGEPSDELHFGTLPTKNGDVEMVFLPRHGRGHVHSPTSINYRANIDVMKRAGVTDIISVSAVGSLKEELPPGTFVIVDQFIDRSFAREKSFFGPGLVAHVSMADPVCPRLGDHIEAACKVNGIAYARGGTYLVMEGPQFSTFAESNLYRSWGCSVIGMTNMPEAKLAREAEIPYATIAMVTDYDCWHAEHENVDVASVIRILGENAENSQVVLRDIATAIGPKRQPSPIDHALQFAFITAPEKRDPALIAKLDAVAGRALKI
ncbi:MAG: S-methyl-5'-thioadenosine phosphorylase [Parvibaculum sp.]